jgi:hypothetical protein
MTDLVYLFPTVFTPYKPDDGPICAAFGPNGVRCAELAGHEKHGLGHLWPVPVDNDPGDEATDLLLENQFFGDYLDRMGWDL